MDHTPKKVFVLKDDEYIEITFQELYEMRKNDQYHFSGISMSELSRMYGVSRQIISRRIKRVYLKLKVMIE